MSNMAEQRKDINDLLSDLVGEHLVSFEQLIGETKKQIFKVSCRESDPFLMKFYFHDKSSETQHLRREFSLLQFLWENDIHNIHYPILLNEKYCYGVYEYVFGEKINFRNVRSRDIDGLIELISELKDLTPIIAEQFVFEEEDSFSIGSLLERLSLTQAELEVRELPEAVSQFLFQEFHTAMKNVSRWCTSRMQEWGIAYKKDTNIRRLFAPANFALNNAIRSVDGEIIFLDFLNANLYDPAKVIAEFVLNPEVMLDENIKRYFVAQAFELFEEDAGLPNRFRLLYPLIGLEYAMNFLLEAKEIHPERVQEIENKVNEARDMLEKVLAHEQHFPYEVSSLRKFRKGIPAHVGML